MKSPSMIASLLSSCILLGHHTSHGLVGAATTTAVTTAPTSIMGNGRNTVSSMNRVIKKKHGSKKSMTTTTNSLFITTTATRIPRGGGGDDGTTTGLSLSPQALAFAESIAPKVGILTSSALYFAPTIAVYNAVFRDNDIGELNPLPLGIMSIVSVAWLAYGITSQDIYVTLSNIGGSIISIAYVVGILPLLGKPQKGDGKNNNSQLRLTQGVIMLGTAITLSMWTILGLKMKDTASFTLKQASGVLGTFASCLFILLCSSPLSTISKVIKTKNSSSILGPLTTAQITNTLLWSIYGLAIKDLFVYGPNIVVCVLTVSVELVLTLFISVWRWKWIDLFFF